MLVLTRIPVFAILLAAIYAAPQDDVIRDSVHRSDSASPEPKLSEVCGKASSDAAPSTNFESNAWPWMVSVRHAGDKDFHCAGTLIASQAVFSAASCYQTEDKKEEAKDIVVYLGLTNANERNGPHTKVSPVSDIYYYHGYRAKTLENNIALLVLETPVSFDEFIKPACIWPNPNVSPGFDAITGQEGYLAKWTGISDVPAEANVVTARFVEEGHCSNYFVSSRSFCAENVANATFCNEDLGEGLLYKRDGRWTLRGIMSRFSDGHSKCSTPKYMLYSDASPMWWWLRATLRDHVGINIES